MLKGAHTIKSAAGSRTGTKRLGRGNASTKGTYAGRGLKGQKSRSGGKGGLRALGFKKQLQKVPKLRGFTHHRIKPETVSLARLNQVCENEGIVTPYILKEKGLITTPQYGVKIVATGLIEKKLKITGCVASKKAIEMIEKAGGSLSF